MIITDDDDDDDDDVKHGQPSNSERMPCSSANIRQYYVKRLAAKNVSEMIYFMSSET